MKESSETNQNYLIIGPRIDFTAYEGLNEHFNIHGDGKKTVEIGKISIEEGSRVAIHAHGSNSGGRHQIALYSSLKHESGRDYTSYNFQRIKKQCNVELFSCHGGNAICDIVALPKDSTLITFVDNEYTMWAGTGQKLMKMSVNFPQPENPFTRFASFLATNADDNRFAINIDIPHRSFRSDINSLEKFSNEDIRAWQKTQISGFVNFIDEAKNHSNKNNREEIEQFIELVKDEDRLNLFVNEFDVNLYRRMLVMNLIKRENIQSINSCLDNIEVTDEDHIFINMAIHEGHKEVLESLLERRLEVNRIYEKYGFKAPLFIAAREGKREMVKLLLEHNADIDCQDSSGRTPLFIAACNGRMRTVDLLLANGANIERTSKSRDTPLLIAIEEGHAKTANLLITNGADINHQNNLGNTPLLSATKKGNLEMVNLLSEKRANVNHVNNADKNPLLIAIEQGHIGMVNLLLEKGANINHETLSGETPLLIAAEVGDVEIARLLLEKGADVNHKNSSGETPLSVATEQRHAEMVNLLIEKITKNIIRNKDFKVLPAIEQLPQELKEKLVEDLNLYIKEEIKQSKGYSIKKIISAFPEEDRARYFAESAKEAIIECAKKGNDRKVELILEAFPNQEEQVRILDEAISIKLDIKATPLLLKLRFQKYLSNFTSSREEAKIKKMEKKHGASREL